MEIFGKDISAAIFDMDGTMFDTERLRFMMLKEASREIYGESMSDEVLMDSLGLSAVRAEALAKQIYGNDYPYAKIRKRADEHEVAYVRKHGVPIKNSLKDVLERLKKNEVLLAVATSSRREIAEEYLNNANIMKYFDVVVCGDEVEQGKPHPEIFLTAASKINCNPKDCLIFEDSENGLLAAIGSGSLPVYIKDIKDPSPEVKAQAFYSCDELTEFLDELIKVTNKYPLPRLNERFPQSYNNMTVGIHGFGAIGGGYITQIFSNWDGYTRPSRIIGATGNALLRNIVNAFDKFTVNYESIAYEQTIKNVSLIDINDEDAIVQMYKVSEIVALSLPEHAISPQAGVIARALLERFQAGCKPLTLLIVLNKVNAASYVKKLVQEALQQYTSAAEAEVIIDGTYFCETVVNRMVSRIPKNSLLKQIQSKLKKIEHETGRQRQGLDLLGVQSIIANGSQPATSTAHGKTDSNSLKNITRVLGNISDIQTRLSRLNIVLYNSEPDVALYASNHSPLLRRLRQVKVVDDIASLQMIKNRLSNGTHAIIAWYSSLLGYKTIGQGMGDERILDMVNRMMEQEIKPILLKARPEHADYIDDFIPAFIKRCRLSFKDPCHRVGRDPIRKLQKNERILGTISMARRHGISTPLLEFGFAAGLLYAIKLVDPEDKESQILRAIYEECDSFQELVTHSGERNDKVFHLLDGQQDSDMVARVVAHLEQYERNPADFLAAALTPGHAAPALNRAVPCHGGRDKESGIGQTISVP